MYIVKNLIEALVKVLEQKGKVKIKVNIERVGNYEKDY